ncbi:MAG TPA: hypothetical protein VEU33_47970 [Archangium sp.]|nr:hypothetical protein [Archangium sp.]
MALAPLDDSRGTSDGLAPAVRERSGSEAARLRAKYAREVARLGNHAHSKAEGLGHLAFHLGLGVGAAVAAHTLMNVNPVAGWCLYPLVALVREVREHPEREGAQERRGLVARVTGPEVELLDERGLGGRGGGLGHGGCLGLAWGSRSMAQRIAPLHLGTGSKAPHPLHVSWTQVWPPATCPEGYR